MTAAAPKRRGLLIALEGIDGAGKSTIARRLVRRWRSRGLRVALVREPTDRDIGATAASMSATDPWQAAIWFTLDRAIGRRRVESALASADIVLADRSFYSTLAYQGSALGPRERARLAEVQTAVARTPDLVVLLDIDPALALQRLARRGTVRAPLEKRAVLERVARAYRRLARSGRWLVVGADTDAASVVAAVDRRVVLDLAGRAARPGERNLSRRRPGVR
jgi:dTMP kinase